jgi:uncharacterized membrane protein YebE (DUF533 family)
VKDRINVLADLLMAAAYSDGHLKGEEKTVVRQLLRQSLGALTLPMDLDFRIDEFRPESFNAAEACAAFTADPPENKRHLLELLAAVHAADQEYDLAEDAFLARVGRALGLADDAFRDLASSVVEEIDLEHLRRG